MVSVHYSNEQYYLICVFLCETLTVKVQFYPLLE